MAVESECSLSIGMQEKIGIAVHLIPSQVSIVGKLANMENVHLVNNNKIIIIVKQLLSA